MWNWAYIAVQCAWGMPQTILGFLLYLRYLDAPHERFGGAVRTRWTRDGGISLGPFIFTPDSEEAWCRKMAAHEYGHTFQSLMLGPLYLFLIGLPSMVWNRCFCGYRNRKQVPYSWFYTERWADRLGEKHAGAREELEI